MADPETLEQLAARVDALEHRVHDLEHSPSAIIHSDVQPLASAAVPSDLPSGEQISGAFLLIGKSLLGIAGAYLLRALADSSVLPRLLIAAIAIAYAIAWLVAASRLKPGMRFAPALYASTSALILAPMLWELTMRFQVLTPVSAAAVLGLFVTASTILNWRKAHAPDSSVAYGAAALTALALSIVTHQTLAFLALLLAMLAVCEYKSVRDGAMAIRAVVAAAADCAAWILILIYQHPIGERGDYPALRPVALAIPASLLLAITAAAVVFKTAALKRRISAFETVQCVIAFLLWVGTGLFLLPHVSARLVGAACLVFAAACYAAAYQLFRHLPHLRNFHVFATWSCVLGVTGVFLTLPQGTAAMCLALASVASAAIAARICCRTLECHAIMFLGTAALACGLLAYSYRALAGSAPPQAGWGVFLVFGCALICYVAARVAEGESWQLQFLHLVPALLAAGAAAAVTTQSLLALASRWMAVDVFHRAFIRTGILCVLALVLAFAGSRWRRVELRRIAYGALVLLAAKLVFEDLRHGHMGYIAASIFLFALTLIGVPRLARARSPA